MTRNDSVPEPSSIPSGEGLPGNDWFYRGIVGVTHGIFAVQGLSFTVSGEENVPATGGGVVVINHTGYMDFTYAGLPFRSKKRLVRFMAKAEVFKHWLAGPLMRRMKHIPVERVSGEASFHTAVDYLRAGELVGVFPESTISRSFEIKPFRTGAVRLSLEADVPIYPVVIWGSQRVWTKGRPKHLGRTNTPIHLCVLPSWRPTAALDSHEAVRQATEELQILMSEALLELQDEYATAHGPYPQGEWWVPARLGGSAPTLAEAQAEDDAVSEERRKRRTVITELNALADEISGRTKDIARTAADNVQESMARGMEHLQAARTAVTEGTAKFAAATQENARDGSEALEQAGRRLFDAVRDLDRVEQRFRAQLRRAWDEGNVKAHEMTERASERAQEMTERARKAWGRGQGGIEDTGEQRSEVAQPGAAEGERVDPVRRAQDAAREAAAAAERAADALRRGRRPGAGPSASASGADTAGSHNARDSQDSSRDSSQDSRDEESTQS